MRAGAVLRGAGSSVAAPQIRFPRSDCRSASPASHERGGATAGGGGVALRHAATCVLKSPCGYRTLRVHFRYVRFLMAIPTEKRGNAGRTESAARRNCVLRNHIGFAMLSAGSTLGLKCGSRTAGAPDCARETSLPGLSSFDSRRGCAYWAARRCVSIAMSRVRLTPAVCRESAKQDGLRNAAFLFRAGRDRH